ncbi:MAG: AlpA family phage regulatory protein [Kangiellaceae bacterium]|nr:AlpA family phage regulatory protein [Kangiellaceae bacterium]
MGHRILKLNDVIDKTQKSRGSIYADMKRGEFPKCFPLTARGRTSRSVGWLESQIDEWIENQMKFIDDDQ